jgi:hypothetical protein
LLHAFMLLLVAFTLLFFVFAFLHITLMSFTTFHATAIYLCTTFICCLLPLHYENRLEYPTNIIF